MASASVGNTPTKESPVCVVPPISNPSTPKSNKVYNAGEGRNTPGQYEGIGTCSSIPFARPRPPCFANRFAPLNVKVDSNNEEPSNSGGTINTEAALLPPVRSVYDLPSATAPPVSPLNRSMSLQELSVAKAVEHPPDHLYKDDIEVQEWLSKLGPNTTAGQLTEVSQLPPLSPIPNFARPPHASPPHHPRLSAILHTGLSPQVANNSGSGRMSPRTFAKTRFGRSPAPIYTHVQELQRTINNLFPENERLSKEIEQLKMALSDKEVTLTKLDDKLRKKDRELEDLQLAKEKIEDDLEAAKKERRDESVRNRQLVAELNSKTKECAQLQVELDKANQSMASLQSKLDLVQADLNASKSLVNQLTFNQTEQLKANSKLQEAERESSANAQGLTRRLVELQDEIAQARHDYETECHRSQLREHDAIMAHTQVAEMREQVAQLSSKLETLQNERPSLEHQANFLSAENKRLMAQLSEAERKILEFTATCGKLQAEADSTQSQKKLMESQILTQGERILALESERTRLETANRLLEREAMDSAAKREEDARTSSLQDQVAQAHAAERERCNNLQEQLFALERERSRQQVEHLSQLADSKALLDSAIRDAASLREQLSQLEQQRDSLRNQYSELQVQIENLGSSNAQLEGHLHELDGQCEELLNQRDQLLSANTKLEEEKAQTIEEARATNQELVDKVIAFESACQQKDAEIERERYQVNNLEAHIQEQQNAISHLETKLETVLQEVHAESDLAIAERDDQISKLNQSLLAARDQVQELQNQLNQTEFNLESVHSTLAKSLVDFERKNNELRDQKDRAVRDAEFLRHELTSKSQQCEQFKSSFEALNEQWRLAMKKLEDASPIIRTLQSASGQLGNIVSSSSNTSTAASSADNDNRLKSQAIESLIDLVNGIVPILLTARNQQPVPSASMPQLSASSLGVGERMQNNGLSRSQDYPNISRSNTSLASSTGSNTQMPQDGPGVAGNSNLDAIPSHSKSYWQSRNQVPPLSNSQIRERFAGPITSTALPKQSIRSKSRPPTEERAHEENELSVTGCLEEIRISELQRRNKAELPHMRSSYALETLAQPLNVAQRLDPVAAKDANNRLNSALMRGQDDSSYCNYLLAGGGSSTAISEFSNFKPTQNLTATPMSDSEADNCGFNSSSAPEDRTLLDQQDFKLVQEQQSMIQQQFTPMANAQFVVPATPAIPCVPVGGLTMGGFTSMYTALPSASIGTPQLHFSSVSGMPTIPHTPFQTPLLFQTPARKAEAFDIMLEPPKSAQKDPEFKTPRVPVRLSQARPSFAPAQAADVSTSIESPSHYKLKKSGFPVMGMLQKSVTPKKKTVANEGLSASAGSKASGGSIVGRMSFRKTNKPNPQTAQAPLLSGASSEQSSALQESTKENVPPPQ